MKRITVILTIILGLTTISAQAGIFGSKTLRPLQSGECYTATITTSEGRFTIKLHNETPIHRDNFVKLAGEGFYTGVLFHRVISDFMIQAGDPSSRERSEVMTYGGNDAGKEMPAEIVPQFFHRKGAVAAARKSDEVNPEKRSSGSQFYVVTGKVYDEKSLVQLQNKLIQHRSAEITPEREQVYCTEGGVPHLDGNYTIFGQVIKGQKTIDKIGNKPTYENDLPKKDVYIKKRKLGITKERKEATRSNTTHPRLKTGSI